MDLKQRLNEFDGAQAIEVAHLLYRYLTHRLDEGSFHRLFLADPSTHGQRSLDGALAAIKTIEAREGLPIKALPSGTIKSYLDELASATRGLQPAEMDPRLRAEAERELTILRAM